ncbi:major facilitator superfamily domain-containing protein [Phycomyces nitens]|nr:major facilitator superfamily domain-containing protein [Phycomyces nitens]
MPVDPNEQVPLLQETKPKKGCCSTNPQKQCCSSKRALTIAPSQETPIDPEDDGDYCHLANQPWKYKCLALACVLLLSVGSHFSAHTLGAMKSIIKKEYDISNSQYGALQSSVSIVNTVLPLIGGIFLDAFGTNTGSILTTVLIASGNILVATSASSANLSMMITGRILYGIGSGTVVIVQETILSQWFKGQSYAIVVAIMLSVSRASSFLAQFTVIPIAEWTGWYGYGLWFAASLCILSFVVNLMYLSLLRRVSDVSASHCRTQLAVVKRQKSFSWSKLLYLPHSYWLVFAMEFLLGGAWGCFLHINSELVKFRFDYDPRRAASVGSVAQVAPIFVMPVLGLFVRWYGKRTWLMIGSGVTFLAALILLGYTYVNPVVGMFLFSLSLAFGPVSLVSSVPVILPFSLVGTGMGLIKSGTNIGASLFDITTGFLQDADQHKGYTGVVLFFIAIGAVSTLCGVILFVLDRTLYHNVLDQSSRTPKSNEDCGETGPQPVPKMVKKLKANWFYGGVYVFLAILSWILFFRFVLF